MNIDFISSIFVVAISFAYFFLSILFIYLITRTEQKKNEYEQQKFYNKSLSEIVDSIRILKNGYENNLASISWYVKLQKFDELSTFINEVSHHDANLDIMNHYSLMKIKNPGLLGLLFAKLEKMKSMEMKTGSQNISLEMDAAWKNQ